MSKRISNKRPSWFDISAIEQDLGYTPIIPYSIGWEDTIQWFKAHWLPRFQAAKDKSVFGISEQSQAKIDTQAASTLNTAVKLR